MTVDESSKDTPNAEPPGLTASRAERIIAATIGVLFLLMFGIFAISNLTTDKPVNAQILALAKQVLAFGGAAFAAIIPGFLSVEASKPGWLAVRGGGAMAALLLGVFFPSPPPPPVNLARFEELAVDVSEAAGSANSYAGVGDCKEFQRESAVANKKAQKLLTEIRKSQASYGTCK